MKYLKYLALVCIVSNPQLLMAAEETEHRYTPKERITFAPATMIAFDRSGKVLTHHKFTDGSTISEHNGSMGNVTVARLGPDGKVETYCTDNASAAKAWMAGEFARNPATGRGVQVTEKKP